MLMMIPIDFYQRQRTWEAIAGGGVAPAVDGGG